MGFENCIARDRICLLRVGQQVAGRVRQGGGACDSATRRTTAWNRELTGLLMRGTPLPRRATTRLDDRLDGFAMHLSSKAILTRSTGGAVGLPLCGAQQTPDGLRPCIDQRLDSSKRAAGP